MSLSKNNSPSLVLVQPRKTRPFITERLLMGRKESDQTNKQNILANYCTTFDYLFELIRERRLYNDSSEFINKNTIKYWLSYAYLSCDRI